MASSDAQCPPSFTCLVIAACLVAASPVGVAVQQQSGVDAAFATFWQAGSPAEAGQVTSAVVASGVSFDEALARLKAGRPYAPDVPTGTLRRSIDGRFPYTLEVPDDYVPGRRYAVRVHLHGGVGRPDAQPPRGIGALRGADQLYLLPAAWADAPWWSDVQAANIRAMLDHVKRTYDVDENRIALSGVSDGASGAYYLAMRDPTPYASVLPLNGFVLVLANAKLGVAADMFPGNLRNRPFFVVNGGRDPLYPAAIVEPYVSEFARRGVDTTYRPQPDAGHDTRWWPDVRDEFEQFVADHPRDPLPDRLSWETSDVERAGRLHWLVIDAIGPVDDGAPTLDDLNQLGAESGLDVGLRVSNRTVRQVIPDSNAAALGFRPGDVIERFGDRAVTTDAEILNALGAQELGSRVVWHVRRDGREVALAGTHRPVEVTLPGRALFERTKASGRVDLERHGNAVELSTRGVTALTLLLSPDEFDFSQPVIVTINGRIVFEGPIEPSVETLLRRAAHDNDRTMLFGAELSLTIGSSTIDNR